jgi:hypothetical protein
MVCSRHEGANGKVTASPCVCACPKREPLRLTVDIVKLPGWFSDLSDNWRKLHIALMKQNACKPLVEYVARRRID